MGKEPGLALVEIDPRRLAEVRGQIPVIQHRRPIGDVTVMP
jgi:hypothetical protein